MDKNEFALKILQTPCEECPIYEYCEMFKYLSCTAIAIKYYKTHNNLKGVYLDGKAGFTQLPR